MLQNKKPLVISRKPPEHSRSFAGDSVKSYRMELKKVCCLNKYYLNKQPVIWN